MRRAQTIREAGYGGALRGDRDLWDPALTASEFGAFYVPRARGDGSDPKKAGVPVARVIETLLLEEPHAKAFLTGQKGSGKSTELRQLVAAPSVAERFKIVPFVVSERLDRFQHSDIRYFLLALAAALAQEIDRAPLDVMRQGLDVAQWVGILKDYGASEPPGLAPDRAFKVAIPGFVEFTSKLRSQEEQRREVLKGDQFTAMRLRLLVSELMGVLRKLSGRELLLVVDDGDKLLHEETVRELFVTSVDALLALPCAAVLTFPYWLAFATEFNVVHARTHVEVLTNVKVVTRDAPMKVLPGAYEFFRKVYLRLVAEGSDWVDADALEEAVRLGAGIPREFLRVMERGFRDTYNFDESRLTLENVRLAARDLRLEMIRLTQTAETRQRLMRVRLTRSLEDVADRKLLDELLIVELTNDEPWYDVHPLLASHIDERLGELRRALQIADDAAPEDAQRQLLETLRG